MWNDIQIVYAERFHFKYYPNFIRLVEGYEQSLSFIIKEEKAYAKALDKEINYLLGSETAVENNISFLRENGYIERAAFCRAKSENMEVYYGVLN